MVVCNFTVNRGLIQKYHINTNIKDVKQSPVYAKAGVGGICKKHSMYKNPEIQKEESWAKVKRSEEETKW